MPMPVTLKLPGHGESAKNFKAGRSGVTFSSVKALRLKATRAVFKFEPDRILVWEIVAKRLPFGVMVT